MVLSSPRSNQLDAKGTLRPRAGSFGIHIKDLGVFQIRPFRTEIIQL